MIPISGVIVPVKPKSYKVGVLDQQCHCHVEACYKGGLLSPISDQRNQNLCFPPGDFVCMLTVEKYWINDIMYIA